MSLFSRQDERWRSPADRSDDATQNLGNGALTSIGDGVLKLRDAPDDGTGEAAREAGSAVEPPSEKSAPVHTSADTAASSAEQQIQVGAPEPSADEPARSDADSKPSLEARREPRSEVLRPLTDGLRTGLGDELVWLQAQRVDLQTELAAIAEQIEAEIAEVDGRLELVEALLGTATVDAAEAPHAARPSPLPMRGLDRTG